MSARKKRVMGFVDGSPISGLYRDISTVLAHQLGGIASALGLRTDALATVLSPADHAALCALTEEIRDVNRMLRLMRGPLGDDALAPAPLMSVAAWWHFVARLTTIALPRGVVVRAQLEAAPLSLLHASTLAHLWLAACKALADGGLKPPCVITLTVTSPADGEASGSTQLLAQLGATHWAMPRDSRSRSPWFRYSTKLARLNGAELHWWTVDHDTARWICSVDRR